MTGVASRYFSDLQKHHSPLTAILDVPSLSFCWQHGSIVVLRTAASVLSHGVPWSPMHVHPLKLL